MTVGELKALLAKQLVSDDCKVVISSDDLLEEIQEVEYIFIKKKFPPGHWFYEKVTSDWDEAALKIR